VLTFELDDEEKRDKKMAAAPSLAKAEEVYSGQDSAPGSPPPAAVGGLPAGWEQRVSKSTGDTYYVNAVTQESSYERPQFPVLPPGWTHNTSRTSGDVYYVDPQGASSYDAPAGAGKPFKPKQPKKGGLLACCAAKPQDVGGAARQAAGSPAHVQPVAEYGDVVPKGEAGAIDLAVNLRKELDGQSGPKPASMPDPKTEPEPVPGSPPPAAVGGLPAGWEQRVSRSTGDTYYVNAVTQESMFERPQFPVLPPGWTHNTSRTSGDVYYVDPQGASSYDAPVGAGKPFKPPDTKQGQAPEPEPEPEPEPLTSMVEIDDMIEVSGGYDPTDRQTSMGDHPGPDRPGWSISSNTPRTQAALDISRNKWEKIDDMRVSIGGLADIVSQARGDVHVVIASCPGVHMDAAVGICGDNRNVSTQATYLLLVVIPGLF
jgi:hypothetical protein